MTNALRFDMARRFEYLDNGLVTISNKSQADQFMIQMKSSLTKQNFFETTKMILLDCQTLTNDEFVNELKNHVTYVVIDEALLCLQWCSFRPVVLRALALVRASTHSLFMLSLIHI